MSIELTEGTHVILKNHNSSYDNVLVKRCKNNLDVEGHESMPNGSAGIIEDLSYILENYIGVNINNNLFYVDYLDLQSHNPKIKTLKIFIKQGDNNVVLSQHTPTIHIPPGMQGPPEKLRGKWGMLEFTILHPENIDKSIRGVLQSIGIKEVDIEKFSEENRISGTESITVVLDVNNSNNYHNLFSPAPKYDLGNIIQVTNGKYYRLSSYNKSTLEEYQKREYNTKNNNFVTNETGSFLNTYGYNLELHEDEKERN